MSGALLRVVLDTNVLLAGVMSASSSSQRVVDALLDRKAIPLVSRPILAEYRRVLLHPEIAARFPNYDADRIEMTVYRLRYFGDTIRARRIKFEFPRDPNDAMFIELAIAGHATHLVTLDPDLLALPGSRTEAGRRFRQRLPTVSVVKPGEFLDDLERTRKSH